jgi:hypothetical protein
VISLEGLEEGVELGGLRILRVGTGVNLRRLGVSLARYLVPKRRHSATSLYPCGFPVLDEIDTVFTGKMDPNKEGKSSGCFPEWLRLRITLDPRRHPCRRAKASFLR